VRLRLTAALLGVFGLAGLVAGLVLPPGAGRVSATGIVAVETGGNHTCALTSAGGLRCWGLNDHGQLGDGTFVSRTRPVDVSGLATGVTAFVAGGQHTCALTPAGGVRCWGHNFFGQLGDGSTIDRATPTAVAGLESGVVGLAGGFFHTCALTGAGTVKCWGVNDYGQLGDGTRGNIRPSPVDVAGLSGVGAIEGGDVHTCALLTTGGVKCWGWNFFGQLGDGTTADSSTPVDVFGLSNALALTSGIDHNCVVTASGATKCWGWNFAGQLGDGTTTDRPTPGDVVGLTGTPSSLTAGGAHTCALVGGAAECWGRNNAGQVGDGTAGNIRPSPTDVVGLPAGISAVSVGGDHSCALGDGDVFCWGRNLEGQLGDGTTANRSLPVAVADAKPPTPTPTRTATVTPTPTPTPTPKEPFGDTDGDTVPNDSDLDDDSDGCSDEAELGPNPHYGGGRNPHVFWDFFDTPGAGNARDRAVNIGDIARVVQRFGAARVPAPSKATAFAEALTAPPPPPAYHAAFDRTAVLATHSGPPNGAIVVSDILLAVMQFGHTCAGPT